MFINDVDFNLPDLLLLMSQVYLTIHFSYSNWDEHEDNWKQKCLQIKTVQLSFLLLLDVFTHYITVSHKPHWFSD